MVCWYTGACLCGKVLGGRGGVGRGGWGEEGGRGGGGGLVWGRGEGE